MSGSAAEEEEDAQKVQKITFMEKKPPDKPKEEDKTDYPSLREEKAEQPEPPEEQHVAWEKRRQEWLGTYREGEDARGKRSSAPLPEDQKALSDIKMVLKAWAGPYPSFRHYYPLEEVIDLYMEVWYDDSSSSD